MLEINLSKIRNVVPSIDIYSGHVVDLNESNLQIILPLGIYYKSLFHSFLVGTSQICG